MTEKLKHGSRDNQRAAPLIFPRDLCRTSAPHATNHQPSKGTTIMGLFDSLFGKKVTLNLTDSGGKPIKRVVSEKQLEQWKSEGKISELPTIRVHILDPMGSHTANWQIGKDISEEIVAKAKDPATGDLYAMRVYEAGVPKTSVLPKEHWLKAKSAMGE